VFHGTRTLVTVPESSKVLERFSGAKPRSAYAFSNILPGTTRARYWSEAVALSAKHEATVLANNPKVLCAKESNAALILDSAPIASMTPPKTIAQIINQIVPSIPDMPPEENRSLRSALAVSTEAETVIAFMIPLYPDTMFISFSPETLKTMSGWKMSAATPPSNVPAIRATNGGVFLTMSTITIRGTKKRTGLI